jgi:recombination protein RecA
MGDAVMGMQARLMSQALRKLTGAISKSNAVMIFTNQLRMKIGVMFGNPETTAGGQALKFYASVRIDMRKIGNITEGEVIIGSRHRAKIVKNKVSPPFKVAEFDMAATGISRSGGVLDVAVEQGIIEKSGSFFKYKGEMLAQGREATKAVLEEKSDLMKKIEKEIWDKIKTTNAADN